MREVAACAARARGRTKPLARAHSPSPSRRAAEMVRTDGSDATLTKPGGPTRAEAQACPSPSCAVTSSIGSWRSRAACTALIAGLIILRPAGRPAKQVEGGTRSKRFHSALAKQVAAQLVGGTRCLQAAVSLQDCCTSNSLFTSMYTSTAYRETPPPARRPLETAYPARRHGRGMRRRHPSRQSDPTPETRSLRAIGSPAGSPHVGAVCAAAGQARRGFQGYF